jgi:hypothetical protein
MLTQPQNPAGTTHTRAEQPDGISPAIHNILAVFYFKGTSPSHHKKTHDKKTHDERNEASTNLALIFGTLLSSQRTDTTIVLTPETLPRLSSGHNPQPQPTTYNLQTRNNQTTDPIRFPRHPPGPHSRVSPSGLSNGVDSTRSFRTRTHSQPGSPSRPFRPLRRVRL